MNAFAAGRSRNDAPLKLTLDPGDYPCHARLPDSSGEQRRLSGTLRLSESEPAALELHGDVPVEVDDRTKMIGFPQTYHCPHIVVDLVNGYQAFMVDCTSTVSLTSGPLKVSPDISRTAFIDAAATLVGPSAFDAGGGPSFDGLKIQITGADGMIAPHPIASVAFPSRREPDLPSEWSVTESLPRESRDSDGQAVVSGYWDCSFSPPNGFGHRVAFSPVMSVELSEPITLERMISDWIEPLHEIVGLSTGRDEVITYAALRSAGGERYCQVFGSNITQAPFASDHNAVRRIKHAFTCFQDNDASLLRLSRGWQRARDELHPLIESLAAFMYVPRQHPRPRFLLLCQALEGLYGFDNRVKVAQRRERHANPRQSALSAIESCNGIDSEFRRFFKENVVKGPMASLEVALRDSVSSSSADLKADLASLPLIDAVRAAHPNRKVHDWAEAFRIVRNDLSHGSRGWDPALLDPAAELLESVGRSHLMRVIGCTSSIPGVTDGQSHQGGDQ